MNRNSIKNTPNEIEIDTKAKKVFVNGNEITCIQNINFNWKGGGLSEINIILDGNVKLKGQVDRITHDYHDLKTEDMYKIDKKWFKKEGD
ncbi:hypothetical protein CLSAB_19290 [Clostridium saccharobutylicum]|uniref:hypothetical protein n=1 Tax=Clostridium saccharobutylicum TaxID=169679 RepID=UPI00098C9607|nr:hypothetical protein [Clostridium saccharobutylicum]OOM17209.1 hypothetical protein CLSAB_19290 [Clostridium saccharobutylicum]